MSSARVRLALIFVGFLFLTGHQGAFAQDRSEISIPPNENNQKAEVSQWIGLVQVTISYHSPRVHLQGTADRTGHIWGELIWYGLFEEGFGPRRRRRGEPAQTRTPP